MVEKVLAGIAGEVLGQGEGAHDPAVPVDHRLRDPTALVDHALDGGLRLVDVGIG
jgi:hypothetical protein